jgi:hypothetical protein
MGVVVVCSGTALTAMHMMHMHLCQRELDHTAPHVLHTGTSTQEMHALGAPLCTLHAGQGNLKAQ